MDRGERLCERFNRLFFLSLDANSFVGEMGEWSEGTWCWRWRWRRELRDRELSMLNDLQLVVNSICPKQGIPDSWKWRSKTKEHYSTKVAYEELMEAKEGVADEAREEFRLIWNKFASSKVQIHAWRTIGERLPTKVNLQRRNCLPSGVNVSYPFCEVHAETVRHIFFECDVSYKVWMECLQWVGVYAVFRHHW